jgi:hypothetical protein
MTKTAEHVVYSVAIEQSEVAIYPDHTRFHDFAWRLLRVLYLSVRNRTGGGPTLAHADLAEAELAELLRQIGIDLSALPAISDSEQLAPVLGTTAAALAQDRYRGGGIPFVKVGRRVRYLRADVCRYLIEHRVTESHGY